MAIKTDLDTLIIVIDMRFKERSIWLYCSNLFPVQFFFCLCFTFAMAFFLKKKITASVYMLALECEKCSKFDQKRCSKYKIRLIIWYVQYDSDKSFSILQINGKFPRNVITVVHPFLHSFAFEIFFV